MSSPTRARRPGKREMQEELEELRAECARLRAERDAALAVAQDSAREAERLRALVEAGKPLADAAQAFLNRKGWKAAPELADALAEYGYAEMRGELPAPVRAALDGRGEG